LGDYDLASEYCQRALAVADEIGSPEVKAECFMVGPAMLASALRQYEEARDLILEGISIGLEIGWSEGSLCEAFAELGNVTLALGEIDEAREHVRKGLKGQLRVISVLRTDGAGGLGVSVGSRGKTRTRRRARCPGLHHPVTRQKERDWAQEQLSELESELSPEALATVMAWGQTRALEEVAAEILASGSQ
jgi:tetratricopeptide (TPR) repeat protein